MNLTTADAERAIYIDFKGLRDAAPVIVGQLVEDVFEQLVVDARFGDAALAKDLRVNSLEDEVAALLERSRGEARRVCAFRRLELEMVDRFTCLGRELASVFVAVQEVVPGGPDRSLADLLRERGHRQPGHLAPRHTTPRLRYVEQQLQRHDAYAAITGTAKAKWTKLLQQNESDCRGTRELLLPSDPADPSMSAR